MIIWTQICKKELSDETFSFELIPFRMCKKSNYILQKGFKPNNQYQQQIFINVEQSHILFLFYNVQKITKEHNSFEQIETKI